MTNSEESSHFCREGDKASQPIILIIEDDPILNSLIQITLRDQGFWVEGLESGKEAISRALNSPSALLLLDYSLPDMTGLEVMDALAKQGCQHPVIVITGHECEDVIEKIKPETIKMVIKKNLHFIDCLNRAVRQFLMDSSPPEEK